MALACISFSITVGYFAYRVAMPLTNSEYRIGGDLEAFVWPKLTGETAEPKVIYLRGTFPLAAMPEYAWLQIIAHDTVRCWVNGEPLPAIGYDHPRSNAGQVVDIASMLRRGTNVIALEVRQVALDRPPAIAVTGEIVYFGGHVRPLDDQRAWRISDHQERHGHHWFANEFNDESWRVPALESRYLVAQTGAPPRAIATTPGGEWISPPPGPIGEGVLAREFEIEGEPLRGWLRFLATGPSRVAVNGVEVASDNDQLAGRLDHATERSLLDISPLLKPGRNQISFKLATPGEEPHLRADLSVECDSEEELYITTDEQWRGVRLAASQWWQESDFRDWELARTENSGLGLRAAQASTLFRELETTLLHRVGNWLRMTAYMLFTALVSLGGAWLTWWFAKPAAQAARLPFSAMCHAFVLPTCAAAAGIYATADPSIGEAGVYQWGWLLLLWLALVTQWAAFIYVTRSEHPAAAAAPHRDWRRYATVAFIVVVTLVAAWIRFGNIYSDPIHHDEVSGYGLTMGTVKYGFPGGQFSKDLPLGWAATSELVYFFNLPAALAFEDPLLVLRVPSVLWSLATLLLLFHVGRKLFGMEVAIVTTILYCLSPYCVGMATFGRYFSQLQFFVLLTCYWYYRTIEGRGPINRRALWITTASFIAMYLSWEGAGLIAPGMVLAAWLHRRGRMKTIICCPSIYAAIATVGVVFLAQGAHRVMQQTQRLWVGNGISDLEIVPMWRTQFFEPQYYFFELSWIKEGMFPLLTLVLAIVVACRSRYQYPLRVFLIIVLANCGAMMAMLPLRSGRYTYHLIPLGMLCAVAGVVAILGAASRLLGERTEPIGTLLFGRVTRVAALGIFVVLACGHLVIPSNIREFRTTAFSPQRMKFNNWDGPVEYVRQNWQPGDVIIASLPHAVNHTMRHTGDGLLAPDWQADYWLQTTLVLQATISDRTGGLLDRRSGVAMLYSEEGVQHLFDSSDRIWYLTTRSGHASANTKATSELMRQNMDVVYEDFQTAVLLRDNQKNRTAATRQEDDDLSRRSRNMFID